MKYTLALLLIIAFHGIMAQTAPVVEIDKRSTLEERFSNMKTKAESYQDYKVIKAVTLDAEWRIFMDSIRANKKIWQDVKKSIAGQQAELKNAQDALKAKEASMTDIVYSSEHISFAGIAFSKKTFILIFMVLVGGLIAGVGLLITRLKLMDSTIREKADLAEVTMREYEEYKHKALDKQTKLSRELQNERNKLSELRHG